MKLTKHFKENWKKRVGKDVSVNIVEKIIDASVVIQKGDVFYLEKGGVHNTLSIFWHPGIDVIISVDPFRETAVSVLSQKNWKFGGHGKRVKIGV